MDMTIPIPERLVETCHATQERRAWLEQLPNAVREARDRWSLVLGNPIDSNEVSCSWVAPAVRSDGKHAMLKLGMPHMEAQHEIHALRFWDGDAAVHLLEADENLNAMLLERCEPGTPLRHLPEQDQDVVIAGLLRRLWRIPPASYPFRPLATMTACWAQETLADADSWPDAGLVQEGLRLFEMLPRTSATDVLLATDLHAGNVLQAQREPWLVIDPKPFIGDAAYDATQHLFNCAERLSKDPVATIRRFADLLEVDETRVRLWMFARAAINSRDDDAVALARLLA